MTTLTNPADKASDGLGAKPDEFSSALENADKEAEAPRGNVEQFTKELIESPLGSHWVELPVRIARQISAIYLRVVGPPFTEQDRKRAILAHAENVRRSIMS